MAEEQKTGCSPSDCAGCSHAGECGSKPQSLIKPENKKSHINHVIELSAEKAVLENLWLPHRLQG